MTRRMPPDLGDDTGKPVKFLEIYNNLIRHIEQMGDDLTRNYNLCRSIMEARYWGMEESGIQEALRRGRSKVKQSEWHMIEALTPGGASLLMEFFAHRPDVMEAEISRILLRRGGRLMPPGAERPKFERQGLISIWHTKIAQEEIEKLPILQVRRDEGTWLITVAPEEYWGILERLTARRVRVDSAHVDWVPKPDAQVALDERHRKRYARLMDDLRKAMKRTRLLLVIRSNARRES
jgi:transcriptional/translational regulatory protein YebC/TACO1